VLALPSLLLTRGDGTPERRRVLASRPHKRFVLVSLEGVSTANDAEALIGCGVAVHPQLVRAIRQLVRAIRCERFGVSRPTGYKWIGRSRDPGGQS
jgi:hypothetical protein